MRGGRRCEAPGRAAGSVFVRGVCVIEGQDTEEAFHAETRL